ncbi:MAG: 3'-5' exonuclease, partial [Elusimicrobiota bacterium]
MRTLISAVDDASLTRHLAGELRAREALSIKLIAVPSQAARYWLLTRLAQENANDLPGVNVITLHQLMLETFTLCATPAPDVIEDKRYLSLLWELLRQEAHGLRYPERDPYPTVEAVYGLMRELRDAAVTTDEAKWLTSDEPYEGLPAIEVLRAKSIFALYGRYVAAMAKNGWTDSPKMAKLAADALAQDREDKFPHPVWLWGFTDFIGVQKLYLQALAKNTDDIGVLMTEHPFTRDLRDEITGWGFTPLTLAPEPRPQTRAALMSCVSVKSEATLAAERLLALSQQGTHWHECAIIVRDLTAYGSAIKRALLSTGIPWVAHEDPLSCLAAHDLGGALTHLVEFLQRPSSARLIAFLTHPGSKCPPDIVTWTANLTARVISMNKEALIKLSGQDTLPLIMRKLLEIEGDCPQTQVERVLAESLRWIEIYKNAGNSRLWRLISRTIRQPKDPALKRGLRRFLELFRNLQDSNTASRDFSLELLLRAIATISLDSNQNIHDTSGVWLLSANQARGASFEHVFILGCADQVFPMES